MQQSVKTIAVLDNHQVQYSKNHRTFTYELSEPRATISEMMALAAAIGIDILWVAPGSQASDCTAGAFLSHDEDHLVIYPVRYNSKGEITFLKAYRSAGIARRDVYIGFPAHDPRWPWQSLDAKTLLKTNAYIQDALGIAPLWSPGHVSRDLMNETNAKRPAWIRDPGQLPNEVETIQAHDLSWKDTIDPSHVGSAWLHLYDKNSAYLGAATSAYLGAGAPLYSGMTDIVPFDPTIPGLWHISTDCEAGFYPRLDHAWLWTPEVAWLVKHASVEIHRAFYWAEKHQALRPWAERLWSARQALNVKMQKPDCMPRYSHAAGRSAAYASIKAIATQGLGWLAHKPESGATQWYRPDWWSMIVSEARSKILWKLDSLEKQHYHAVWVNVDELGFISGDPNPHTAIPGLTERATQLGGFKHAYSFKVTHELCAAFLSATKFRHTQEYLSLLKEDADASAVAR